MTTPNRPFLDQFASPSQTDVRSIPLVTDSTTGLLWRASGNLPFIEELLSSQFSEELAETRIATFLTESTDQPDPDLVRVSGAEFMDASLVTLITRSEPEPADPDYVRLDQAMWLSSQQTKMVQDEIDPDLVRCTAGYGTS